MKPFASALLFIPFVMCVTSEIYLFGVLCQTRARTRYRAFESYVAVSLASALVCLGAAAFFTTSEYFFAYYFAQVFKTVALEAALYEQFAILFLPRWVMPDGALRGILLLLSAILITSLISAWCWPQATPYWTLAMGRRFVAWQNTAVFCSLIGLIIAKDHYGIYLRSRCRSIIAGLMTVTGIGIIESFALSFSTDRRIPQIVGYFTTIAFLLVTCSWAKHFATSEEIHLTLNVPKIGVIPHPVCLKKSPTSCALTGRNTGFTLFASGEQKAKQCSSL